MVGGILKPVNAVILDGTEPLGSGSKTKTFGTLEDNQPSVLIVVHRGAAEEIDQCVKMANTPSTTFRFLRGACPSRSHWASIPTASSLEKPL